MNVDIYEQMYLTEKDNWWFKGRRELITEMVARACKPSWCGALKILDVGCGTGLNSKAFEEFGEIYGVDISKDALKFCRLRGNSTIIRANTGYLPIKNNSFDLLLALDLLEHVEDDIGAIKEFFRILKPNGTLILTVPAFMFLWSDHDIALHHKRRYNKDSLVKVLKSSGYSIERLTCWNFFLFPMVAFIRLFSRGGKDEESGRYRLPDLSNIGNTILLWVLRVEKAAISRGYNFPIGVSIICICRKSED